MDITCRPRSALLVDCGGARDSVDDACFVQLPVGPALAGFTQHFRDLVSRTISALGVSQI